MTPAALSTIVSVVNSKLSSARPTSLCTAYGVSHNGLLEFHLLNDKTGDAIVISEETDHMTADILAEDMTNAIDQLSTTQTEQ